MPTNQRQLITREQLREEEELMGMRAHNAQRRRHEESSEFGHRQNVRMRLAINVFIFAMGCFGLAFAGGLVFVFWRLIIRT